MRGKIKFTALALMCCFMLAACGKSADESAPASAPASSGKAAASVSGTSSDSAPSAPPAAVGSSQSGTVHHITSQPTVDEPAEIYGIHEYNYVYNPNGTDTSNQLRYYDDFEWVDGEKPLWTSTIQEKPWGEYDAEAALAYGRAHWDDGEGLCAEFLSRCVTAGGITEFTLSSTSISLQLLHSGLGFGQFVRYNKNDHTISLPEYARAGDVVQIYCSYEGLMIHSLLMVGTDDEGKLRAVCHNMRNGGYYTFYIDDLNDPCYDCESETVEVFFYHFYNDDDVGLPEAIQKNRSIILWEERGYIVPDQKYDRDAALKYARDHCDDGFGVYGAQHTWDILRSGGLNVGYSNQSALFFQLLKTHLGQAYSLPVRDDRTVILPQYAEPGDIAFMYCPYDGMIISSFIVSGRDHTGRMLALSFDELNDGRSAFRIDSYCPGCGDDIREVVLYHFE